MKKHLHFILFLFLFTEVLNAQQIIELQNPSFEGEPKVGTRGIAPADGWYDCGEELHPGESPPDLHGEKSDGTFPNFFGVDIKAAHGKTFLGLVLRNNNTWEVVCQRLSSTLIAGKTYSFSLNVARSDDYKSATPNSREDQKIPEDQRVYTERGFLVNHNYPAILKIWGADTNCGSDSELLYQSSAIENTEWEELNILLKPETDRAYIILEAYYQDDKGLYLGNLLIDNCSSIKEVIPKKVQD